MEGLGLLLKKSQAEGVISGLKIASYTFILHLLFVDDILILSKAILTEWRVIDKLLTLFCKASGLAVNLSKSTAHYSGLSDQDLVDFKAALNFAFSDLNIGFRYLGYHLKTGTHRASYWDWIVAKISHKINLWANKWLSLAGRFILVKSVLEGQTVYWMSLEALPCSILSKIRKMIFDFLWNGHQDRQRIHLWMGTTV
jgi:hypothetical protein